MANTTGKKYGGRKRGTPNKTTQELREALQKFIEDNLDTLQDDYQSIKDADKRLSFFEKIVRHVLPPPLNPESLTVQQLEEIIDFLKNKQNEKET